MGILAKLWRGELPLYVTFWFFGMIFGTVISICVTNYALQSEETANPVRIGWLIIALFYTGIMCVALWRSADKYEGAPVWSIGARFYSAVLFMSFVSFAVDLANIIF